MAGPDLSALDPTKVPKPPNAANPYADLGGELNPLGGSNTGVAGGLSALGGPQQSAAMPAAPPPPQAPAAPAAAPAAPAATGGLDPNAALGQVQSAFQTKHNRAMTPEEQQALTKYVGYTGGAVDQGTLDKALGAVGQYSGNLANPFGSPAAAAAPAGPAAPPPEAAIGTGNAAQAELQKLLTTGSTDAMQLDMNNPAIQAQRTNFDRVNSRATGRERLAAAERNAARGTLGSGGYDADLAAAEQSAGDRSAGFESQLMTQELGDQRNRVMSAMQMALQSGDSAQARALQERLGQLDASLRKEGMGIQNSLGKGQLNLGLLNAMLGDKQASGALGLGYFNGQNSANLGLLNSIMNGF